MFWATSPASYHTGSPARERVLPTGAMHLAIRLGGGPLRLFDNLGDAEGQSVGHAVAGGARSGPYIRDVSEPVLSVGVLFRHGVGGMLVGVPAGDLAGRHTPLDDLWGASARELRDRLAEAGSPERALDRFEMWLAGRLPRVRGLHPAVAHALERFVVTADVREVVRQTGYSHRRFVAVFREAIGLTPKVYCRVIRLQRALRVMAQGRAASLTDASLAAGYCDQAHLTREFRDLAGVTPAEYRRAAPRQLHHVPIHGA